MWEKCSFALSDILSSPKAEDDPVALKKAKSAFEACADLEFVDTIRLPELQIVDDYGGMPLLSQTLDDPDKFSWQEVGDMVARFGLPILFDLELVRFNENMYIYVSKDDFLALLLFLQLDLYSTAAWCVFSLV